MLDSARASQPNAVSRSKHASMKRKSFPTRGSFDLVTCRVAAHHFSSRDAFLRKSHGSSNRAAISSSSTEVFRTMSRSRRSGSTSWRNCAIQVTVGSCRQVAGKSYATEIDAVVRCETTPFKQPDLNWYFDTAGTPAENRKRVLELIHTAPESARRVFRIGEEDGKTSGGGPA